MLSSISVIVRLILNVQLLFLFVFVKLIYVIILSVGSGLDFETYFLFLFVKLIYVIIMTTGVFSLVIVKKHISVFPGIDFLVKM